MTRIVLLSQDADLQELRAVLAAKAVDCTVLLLGEAEAELAEVAVCWNPPPGSLGALANLRLIHSMAAGVDHLFNDPSRPALPTCRVVDPDLRNGMAEYVIWGVLHHFRQFDRVLKQQARGEWHIPEQKASRDWRVGVLGLGELGAHVAEKLALLGFEVRGWSRSAKTIPGVTIWFGNEQLSEFADGLDCAICLLPLTEESRGVLNGKLFSCMRRGAVLINSGRGEHLVMRDLISALETGVLRAALLDAFEKEPLPVGDPIWRIPGITVTPHMATAASNKVIAEQILANVERLRRGYVLLNQVDLERGY